MKFLDKIFWDIRDPDVGIPLTLTLGCPGQKTHAKRLFLFKTREWPGCPAIWVETSRDLAAHLGHLE